MGEREREAERVRREGARHRRRQIERDTETRGWRERERHVGGTLSVKARRAHLHDAISPQF